MTDRQQKSYHIVYCARGEARDVFAAFKAFCERNGNLRLGDLK